MSLTDVPTTQEAVRLTQLLILTKPLGLGIISTAAKNGEDRMAAIGDAWPS